MENKTSQHISEKELNGLLNEAFLSLDFENAKNKEALEIVGNYTMRRGVFSRIFSSRRLNFLLLTLSALIFLNSFYRYLEPIINKDDKKYGPVLGITTVKKNEVPVLNGSVFAEPQKVSMPLISKAPAKKRKLLPNGVEKGKNLKAVVLEKAEKTDSVLVTSPSNETIDTSKAVTNPLKVDSINLSQVASNPVPPIAAVKKVKPERKVAPKVSSKNGKTPKIKKGSKLRRNGTFILKGGRYGKSRKIQR